MPVRMVHLPKEKFDECKVCNSKRAREMRVCSSCGESLYCSTNCYRSDRNSHKKNCAKSTRINLETFYPFLACLAESCHRSKTTHPALTHRILNDVNPGSSIHRLPDGSSARLLILGPEVSPESMLDPTSKEWFPLQKSLRVASKLATRILREGYTLQICLAVCTALVMEMYTMATSVVAAPTEKKRMRMRYRSTPVSDFGICSGSVYVRPQDRLAYWKEDGELIKGQDPDNHYWIYFRTMAGEEVILDLAMFTFNLCTTIPTSSYVGDRARMHSAPAFFLERDLRSHMPAQRLHRERRRISILRNTQINEAVRSTRNDQYELCFSKADEKRLCNVMEDIAGRECTPMERRLMMQWTIDSCYKIEDCLVGEDWKQFPEQVRIGRTLDPGEHEEVVHEEADWNQTMRRWKRTYKRRVTSSGFGGGGRKTTGYPSMRGR